MTVSQEEKCQALYAVAMSLRDARTVAASCARIIVEAWAGETIQTLEDGDGAKVGKRIDNAESALGIRLFDATPVGLVLTDEGRAWVDDRIAAYVTPAAEAG